MTHSALEFSAKSLGAAKGLCGDILKLLLPNNCCHCGKTCENSSLCAQCLLKLASLAVEPYCPRCGSGTGENISADDSGCVKCTSPMPRYQRLVRLGSFEGPLCDAVTALKFQSNNSAGETLGKLMAQAISSTALAFRPDIVCPVPLFWRRRLKRGYNQSAILAKTIAGELKIPFGDELQRLRNTQTQVGLSKARRQENMRGAFAAKNPQRIENLSILLVDDVSTTGATANEAAKALLKASAARVILAVAAKAEPPDTTDRYS